jgi:hypothetical protein
MQTLTMQVHYENLRAGWHELRRSSTAWAEVLMAWSALVSGLWIGWPIYNPYQSDAYVSLVGPMPGWFVGALFVLQGFYQGVVAYFGYRDDSQMNAAIRRNGAATGAALWSAVAWILLSDFAPGWMSVIALMFVLFQVLVFGRLLRRRRCTDGVLL